MKVCHHQGFLYGRPPYGYKKIKVRDGDKLRNKLEPCQEDSIKVKAVRTIFEIACRGTGCKDIAKELNAQGFRTETGELWARNTVHKILTNEAYRGTLIWGGRKGHPAARRGETPVRVKNAWPALISREIFDNIQRNMSKRRPGKIHPRTVASQYLLSGILFCSCGSAMIGHSAKSSRNFYYLCSRNYRQGKTACASKMIRKEYLEKTVISEIKKKVLSNDNLEELVKIANEDIAAASKNLRGRLASIDHEANDVRNRLAHLYDALETGKFDYGDLAPRIK